MRQVFHPRGATRGRRHHGGGIVSAGSVRGTASVFRGVTWPTWPTLATSFSEETIPQAAVPEQLAAGPESRGQRGPENGTPRPARPGTTPIGSGRRMCLRKRACDLGLGKFVSVPYAHPSAPATSQAALQKPPQVGIYGSRVRNVQSETDPWRCFPATSADVASRPEPARRGRCVRSRIAELRSVRRCFGPTRVTAHFIGSPSVLRPCHVGSRRARRGGSCPGPLRATPPCSGESRSGMSAPAGPARLMSGARIRGRIHSPGGKTGRVR